MSITKPTTLLIMAAGIGSRFGTGIKQLEPVGLHDEIIMDYSIHDAILAGFNKIIFVIRKDIEVDFRERIGNRVYISEELTIPHGQSDHLSRRFGSLISERDSRRSKSFL